MKKCVGGLFWDLCGVVGPSNPSDQNLHGGRVVKFDLIEMNVRLKFVCVDGVPTCCSAIYSGIPLIRIP